MVIAYHFDVELEMTEEEAGATGVVTGGSPARGPNSSRHRQSRCGCPARPLASCSRMGESRAGEAVAHGRGAPRDAAAHGRDAGLRGCGKREGGTAGLRGLGD